MDNFGTVTINGKKIDLNSATIDNLKNVLTEVENQEKKLSDDLNMILEELS